MQVLWCVQAVAALPDAFLMWEKAHQKVYPTHEARKRALVNWLDNDRIIAAHNALHSTSFTLGHNQLSDLSNADYRAKLLSADRHSIEAASSRQNGMLSAADHHDDAIGEDSVDWAARGVVTKVKNQQRCGGCWAFATTGAIESAFAIRSGAHPIPLSEEQLIACDYAADACKGGSTTQALEFVADGNPLCNESAWPYTSGEGSKAECKSECKPAVAISSFETAVGDEGAIVRALRHQPVAVSIEADASSFQLYHSGVYDDPMCGTRLDHAVLLTGYAADERGVPYYHLKNSWGSGWGERGFMRIARGNNTCGLASIGAWPTGVTAATPAAAVPRPPTPPQPPPSPPALPPPGANLLIDAMVRRPAGTHSMPPTRP